MIHSLFRADPGPVKLNGRPAVADPVGIVCMDIELLAAYLEFPLGPYVVIRKVEDVPKRLGGLAILSHEGWPPGLAEVLAKAAGLA